MSNTPAPLTNAERDYDYIDLNALLKFTDKDGNIRLDAEKLAVRKFFLTDINQNTVFFHSIEEKLEFLFEEGYYDRSVFEPYTPGFVKSLFKAAYAYKKRFESLMGARKFYSQYALKTRDGTRYLERYEDRVVTCALGLGNGNAERAAELLETMMEGIYQPATPTFQNVGKMQRGEYVSCFLLRTEDNMESIARTIANALQLSKRGGGVAINLSNLRGMSAPIKGIANCAAGVLPVMKLLEDAFSYADQLGSRQGSGAAYLDCHHIDVLTFLDTKRENADEKIRVKTLSIGLVMSNIVRDALRKGRDFYAFCPYDVKRVTGKDITDIDMEVEYQGLASNKTVRKIAINARKFLHIIAELYSEAGYPYLAFSKTINDLNTNHGRINMSNLCTEILQTNSGSSFHENGNYEFIGQDISCNLGSLNVLRAMESGEKLPNHIERAVRALTAVSQIANTSCVPSVELGNDQKHAIGLGQMNLHGFFMSQGIDYASELAVQFTDTYFGVMAFNTIKASNKLAVEHAKSFDGFELSTYADGSFFEKYFNGLGQPSNDEVRKLFAKFGVAIPTIFDWKELCQDVVTSGIYNAYLQAVAPTGSISYVNYATASIHPVADVIEVRKEGKTGRIYYASPELTNDNKHLYKSAYDYGNEPIIRIYAAATPHIDQGASLTTFFKGTATTRDVIKMILSAWDQGCKTLYYARFSQDALEGTERPTVTCESCEV